MKIHLFVVLFVFHWVASGALKAQSAFTFECVCDYVAPPDCDLCNTSVKERLFNGLLIRRYDSATSSYKAFKWIDAPYSVKQRNDELLEIFELFKPFRTAYNVIATARFRVSQGLASLFQATRLARLTHRLSMRVFWVSVRVVQVVRLLHPTQRAQTGLKLSAARVSAFQR